MQEHRWLNSHGFTISGKQWFLSENLLWWWEIISTKIPEVIVKTSIFLQKKKVSILMPDAGSVYIRIYGRDYWSVRKHFQNIKSHPQCLRQATTYDFTSTNVAYLEILTSDGQHVLLSYTHHAQTWFCARQPTVGAARCNPTYDSCLRQELS